METKLAAELRSIQIRMRASSIACIRCINKLSEADMAEDPRYCQGLVEQAERLLRENQALQQRAIRLLSVL